MSFHIGHAWPGCIPCKTYTEGTPSPKLSYARYFQGEGAAKNLSTDDFKKLSVLAQAVSFLMKVTHVLSKETAKILRTNLTFTPR